MTAVTKTPRQRVDAPGPDTGNGVPMPETAYKRCSKCGETKPLDSFYRQRARKDGRFPHCKACNREQAREWREKNPDRKAEHQQRYRQRHPKKSAEQHRRYQRRYHLRYPGKRTEIRQRHRRSNPLKNQARAKLYRAVQSGKIEKPQKCEGCGSAPPDPSELHGHHADYSKPLDVEWLCGECHVERHREEPRVESA